MADARVKRSLRPLFAQPWRPMLLAHSLSILRLLKPMADSAATRPGKSSGPAQSWAAEHMGFLESSADRVGIAGSTMTRFPRFDPFQIAITVFGAAFFVGLSLFF